MSVFLKQICVYRKLAIPLSLIDSCIIFFLFSIYFIFNLFSIDIFLLVDFQFATDKNVFLFDVLELPDNCFEEGIRAILENPDVLKVSTDP